MQHVDRRRQTVRRHTSIGQQATAVSTTWCLALAEAFDESEAPTPEREGIVPHSQ